jgi:predicted  nucleic acid-binding Zn-ribbon protein
MRSIEFQTFIDLVTFDQSLVKIERDIKKSQEVQESLLVDIERLQADFADIKIAKFQARKAVDEKELYMKVLDDKESELKNKLASISNQKEYKSLEKETLLVNAERVRHEQELLVLWNKLDALDKTYEFKYTLHEEQAAKFHAQVEAIKNEVAAFQAELEVLTTQRLEKQQNIPQEWLDMYVNMKGRVTNPVVPVINESCDACFYSVTARDLQMLRRNKLLQCRDCYRVLYVEGI